jgi:hypothetical protein
LPANQKSCCCLLWYNAVSERVEPKGGSVQLLGSPISASTNTGLSAGPSSPPVDVGGAWWPLVVEKCATSWSGRLFFSRSWSLTELRWFAAHGVGHCLTAASVSVKPGCAFASSPVARLPLARESVAVGVGHWAALVHRLGGPALGRVELLPFWLLPYGEALGVGQDEDALSSVWCADI